MTPVANVRRLRHVGLVVPDLLESARFYEEIWGLRYADDQDGVVQLRGSGSEHHLLELHPGTRKGIHHLSFALDSFKDVGTAAEGLRERGLRVVHGPIHLDREGCATDSASSTPKGEWWSSLPNAIQSSLTSGRRL
jgi:catechol 2,3-dioxygenase-like lactoylglutathione lyase family enzyme